MRSAKPEETSASEYAQPAAEESAERHAPLSVRLPEELALASAAAAKARPARVPAAAEDPAADLFEAQVLDEEIAFRSAELSVHEPLPANLIEFPRQLVASRKARPRLAEGPLLAEAEARGDVSQLRIFEVEPSQVSHRARGGSARAPEWTTMVLGAQVAAVPAEAPEGQTTFNMLPQTAPIGLRLMAGLVDGCIVLAAALAFFAVFALTAHALPRAEDVRDDRRARGRRLGGDLPGAVLHAERGDAGNALCAHRAMHLQRGKPDARRDAQAGNGDDGLRRAAGPGISMGVAG